MAKTPPTGQLVLPPNRNFLQGLEQDESAPKRVRVDDNVLSMAALTEIVANMTANIIQKFLIDVKVQTTRAETQIFNIDRNAQLGLQKLQAP